MTITPLRNWEQDSPVLPLSLSLSLRTGEALTSAGSSVCPPGSGLCLSLPQTSHPLGSQRSSPCPPGRQTATTKIIGEHWPLVDNSLKPKQVSPGWSQERWNQWRAEWRWAAGNTSHTCITIDGSINRSINPTINQSIKLFFTCQSVFSCHRLQLFAALHQSLSLSASKPDGSFLVPAAAAGNGSAEGAEQTPAGVSQSSVAASLLTLAWVQTCQPSYLRGSSSCLVIGRYNNDVMQEWCQWLEWCHQDININDGNQARRWSSDKRQTGKLGQVSLQFLIMIDSVTITCHQ